MDGQDPRAPADEDIQARARRVEAEREAVRSVAYFKRLSYDARVEALEREREAAERTLSWRDHRAAAEGQQVAGRSGRARVAGGGVGAMGRSPGRG